MPSGQPPRGRAQTARRPALDRQHIFNEQVRAQGGMTPLLYAVRQGYTDVALALLDAGVDVNQRKGGDNASALLVATVNGQFDLAATLLERGANPNLARRERRRAALRRDQPDVGAASRLSAAARRTLNQKLELPRPA